MNIKKTANLLLNFATKRIAELLGILISIGGVLLFIALMTYSPDDPNFIFPKDKEIKNLLGFNGSFVSDLFFQSIGLISYLVSITFILTGINIIINKKFFLIIENIFFAVLYSLLGTLFLSYFYLNNFSLYINGTGGFVGIYLTKTFLNSVIQFNESIFFYSFIIVILFLFLICIFIKSCKFILVSISAFIANIFSSISLGSILRLPAVPSGYGSFSKEILI